MDKTFIIALAASACLMAACAPHRKALVGNPSVTATSQDLAPASVKGMKITLMSGGYYTEELDGEPERQTKAPVIILYFAKGDTFGPLPDYGLCPGSYMSYKKAGNRCAVVHRQEVDPHWQVTLKFDTPTSGKADYICEGSTICKGRNVPFTITPINKGELSAKDTIRYFE